MKSVNFESAILNQQDCEASNISILAICEIKRRRLSLKNNAMKYTLIDRRRNRRRRKTSTQIRLPKNPQMNIGARTLQRIRGLIFSRVKIIWNCLNDLKKASKQTTREKEHISDFLFSSSSVRQTLSYDWHFWLSVEIV